MKTAGDLSTIVMFNMGVGAYFRLPANTSNVYTGLKFFRKAYTDLNSLLCRIGSACNENPSDR